MNSKLILSSPLIFKSAYSDILKNIINYLKRDNKESQQNLVFELFKDSDFNDLDVNGIKVTKDKLDQTINFCQNFTLEPPNTFFAKECMSSLDYIFYEGKVEVVSTLNPPNVYKMLDLKYLPNKIYPSDHINLTADFILNI